MLEQFIVTECVISATESGDRCSEPRGFGLFRPCEIASRVLAKFRSIQCLWVHLLFLAIAVGLVTEDTNRPLRVEHEPGVANDPYVIKVPLVLQGRAEHETLVSATSKHV